MAPTGPDSEQGAVDQSNLVDGVDVDAVVTAVIACPSVSGMVSGAMGDAMTLLPGRQVPGVRVTRSEVRVDVRVRWGSTAQMVGREVRAAVTALLAGHRLHIVIGDIDAPGYLGDIGEFSDAASSSTAMTQASSAHLEQAVSPVRTESGVSMESQRGPDSSVDRSDQSDRPSSPS